MRQRGVAIPLVLALGIICGLFNGLLIAAFSIPPMIATMGTQYVIRGIAYAITSSKSMSFKNEFLRVLGRNYTIGIPNSFIVMALVFFILSYMLNLTTYGRKVYSVGSNPNASYLAGISPVRIKLGAYAIAGLSSALAGIVMSGQLGASVPSLGTGSEMEIIAAVYLGGVATSGGRGNLFGTWLGVLIITVINNGLVHLGVQSFWTTIVRGAVIIIAVYVDTIRKQREEAAR
jgi:ribose transport system permease protein